MKNIVLIFDVETTGLYDKKKPIEQQPYILQMSYLLYDIAQKRIVKAMDSYVKVHQSIEIKPEVTAINHCTRELCNDGLPIQTILTNFYYDYHLAETVIAHNYDFDSTLIRIEFQRNWSFLQKITPQGLQLFDPSYMSVVGVTKLCTMKDTVQMVKAPHKKPKPDDVKNGNFKWPSLIELHTHCYGYVPDNMHNSMMDVFVTLRCLMKYKYNTIITREEMDAIVNTYMGMGVGE